MYLHIWLPLGIKIWHWKIFGLKLFIINLEEGLEVCVCVFEGRLVIRFSFVIRAQSFWVWWLEIAGLGGETVWAAVWWALQKWCQGPRQPSAAPSLLLFVGQVFAARLWGACSVALCAIGSPLILGLSKCLAKWSFWKYQRRGWRRLWKQTPSSSHFWPGPKRGGSTTGQLLLWSPSRKVLSQNQILTLTNSYVLVSWCCHSLHMPSRAYKFPAFHCHLYTGWLTL